MAEMMTFRVSPIPATSHYKHKHGERTISATNGGRSSRHDYGSSLLGIGISPVHLERINANLLWIRPMRSHVNEMLVHTTSPDGKGRQHTREHNSRSEA